MAAPSPYIALHKLGEYLQADVLRRRAIIKDHKRPESYATTRYQDAKAAIADYIVSGYDKDVISRAISSLNHMAPTSTFQESDRNTSIELLGHALTLQWPNFAGCTFEVTLGEDHIMQVGGIEVRVNPNLIIQCGNKIGCLKMHTSKTVPFAEETLEDVATLLHLYTEDALTSGGLVAARELCVAVDVFTGRLCKAPKAFTRRLRRLEAAGTEISALWPAV